MSTGVNAIKVDAMPAFAYSTAIRDRDTPMKGPKKVVRKANRIPLLFFSAALTSPNCLLSNSNIKNPVNPKTALMNVPAKGIAKITDSHLERYHSFYD